MFEVLFRVFVGLGTFLTYLKILEKMGVCRELEPKSWSWSRDFDLASINTLEASSIYKCSSRVFFTYFMIC